MGLVQQQPLVHLNKLWHDIIQEMLERRSQPDDERTQYCDGTAIETVYSLLWLNTTYLCFECDALQSSELLTVAISTHVIAPSVLSLYFFCFSAFSQTK